MSLLDPTIQPAVVDKCFVQYLPDSPPSLHGVLVNPADDTSGPSIQLAPGLLTTAVGTVSAAFRVASSPLADRVDSAKDTLPVTVICSPDLNSLVAVDATVRYIAHSVEADLVILDPADLADGRRGVFGEELTDAFWQLYSHHYANEEVHDDPNPGSTSGDPKTKIEDPRFTRARDLVQRFFLMQSSIPETSLNRRRIVYLRDYGALSKAMLPLLPALFDATSSGPPTLVVAGISPIQRVVLPEDSSHRSNQKTTQHERFLGRMDCDFLEYLDARYGATLRKPDSLERYQSLEHIFTSTFINRYRGQALHHRPRRRLFMSSDSDSKSPPRGSRRMRLRFARIVRVGFMHDPPLQDVTQTEREKRFLGANLWLIHHHAALQGKSFDFNIEHCYKLYIDQVTKATVPTALTSAVLNKARLNHVANSLPSSPEFMDVLHAVDSKHMPDSEWTQVLNIAKKSNETTTVDRILARIRGESLSEHEKKLLPCVVDPTTIQTTFADVYVQPEITTTLRMAVMRPILHPEDYATGILAQESMGGVLLFGPPGTGKTLVCRALAKECGARMLELPASIIQQCAVGETEKAPEPMRHNASYPLEPSGSPNADDTAQTTVATAHSLLGVVHVEQTIARENPLLDGDVEKCSTSSRR
ncbi:hypothetical protein C8F04DRAFT_1279061 [Mycena alexandri]|uniref:ATPase AAA-type core domain-containing protein n=1 Tax=Mycena alexandri TaxID=1745969 RepID=A0AAD6RZ05_9AGAR|nr:hypothetical protein C8F04DRAFT_1279061 [Mycena alexandri]